MRLEESQYVLDVFLLKLKTHKCTYFSLLVYMTIDKGVFINVSGCRSAI